MLIEDDANEVEQNPSFLDPPDEFMEPRNDILFKSHDSKTDSKQTTVKLKRHRQKSNISTVLKCLLGEGIVVELKNDSGKESTSLLAEYDLYGYRDQRSS